ncbi:MAG: flagellar biosynthesis protein FliQ [Alphaproteobacteria bacterium]
MTPAEVIDVGNDAILTLLIMGAPVLGVALAVGLLIALFQALTQMQEMTLSFVPKILTTVVALMLFLPFMISTLLGFGENIFERIAGLG